MMNFFVVDHHNYGVESKFKNALQEMLLKNFLGRAEVIFSIITTLELEKYPFSILPFAKVQLF